MLFPLIVILTGSSYGLFAQKRISKSLLDPRVSSIVIEGEQCFRIDVRTADTDQVTVEAEMQGEYQSDVLVHTETLGNTLNISTAFAPSFQMPNDKLGAHKVLSIDLRVTLPHYQRVSLSAGTCQVQTAGRYRTLKVSMNDGGCKLNHTAEQTEVRTRTAPILAKVKSGTVNAESRYGIVAVDAIPVGGPHFRLWSNRGDIRVMRKP